MQAEVKECPHCGSYYDARSLECPCVLIGDMMEEGRDALKELEQYSVNYDAAIKENTRLRGACISTLAYLEYLQDFADADMNNKLERNILLLRHALNTAVADICEECNDERD